MLITIPVDLKARLNADPIFTEHEKERLHPLLTRHAGEQKYDVGINMLLTLAFYDYCEGMPAPVLALMNMRAENYIRALTPDNESFSAVKKIWDSVH